MSAPATSPSGGVEMTVDGDGTLLNMLRHVPSGTRWTTDAPKDNGGEGTSFSPTDMLAASLASCMITTMALAAKREGVAWGPARARVVKHMGGPPRRVAELVVELAMPKELPTEKRAEFEQIAYGCPVARSLSSDTQVTLTFSYP